MKPRLKLHLDGSASVLTPAPDPHITCRRADALIAEHYGNRMEFAIRWRLSYSAVTAALRDDNVAWRTAGRVAHVRQILGMQSEPSEASRKLAAAHERRRAGRSPDWVFEFPSKPRRGAVSA